MSKIDLLFTSLVFLLLPLQELETNLAGEVETNICLLLILTIGISHGAIDHHLYGVANLKENLKFVGLYILIALFFASLWYWQPELSFSAFLLISAFHFGQSQFTDLNLKRAAAYSLYFIWGLCLLSAFIFLNHQQFDLIADDAFLMDYLKQSLHIFKWLFYLLSAALVLFLFGLRIQQQLGLNRLLNEFYEMLLIGSAFYLFSPLLGFSLYFVVLHSLRVLNQEFKYLKRYQGLKNLGGFLKLLAPFTLISIGGMSLLLLLNNWLQADISYTLGAIVFISALTAPHALVMHSFYRKNK